MSMIMVTTAMAASSAITMTTIISGGTGGALIAILLVSLLSTRELISVSTMRSKRILATMDAVVVPLLLLFVASVLFQFLEIVYPLS
jgi:hypothetical protein